MVHLGSAEKKLRITPPMIAATTIGVVSQPLNDGCGSLKGAELTLSPPFSPSLDGFGFYGSGS